MASSRRAQEGKPTYHALHVYYLLRTCSFLCVSFHDRVVDYPQPTRPLTHVPPQGEHGSKICGVDASETKALYRVRATMVSGATILGVRAQPLALRLWWLVLVFWLLAAKLTGMHLAVHGYSVTY